MRWLHLRINIVNHKAHTHNRRSTARQEIFNMAKAVSDSKGKAIYSLLTSHTSLHKLSPHCFPLRTSYETRSSTHKKLVFVLGCSRGLLSCIPFLFRRWNQPPFSLPEVAYATGIAQRVMPVG